MKKEQLELIRGSGNVYRDLGKENADIEQFKAILAAEIVKTLDSEGLSVRKAHDRTGIAVPFFGRPARSVTIPAMIARRVGARIWLSRCLRLGNRSRFQIELKELKVPRTANQADDVKWITAEMQKQFEAWIREAPEQWSWNNRRWG